MVEEPVYTIDFASAVNGREVALSADMPADISRVYVYWGDRKRTVSTLPAQDFAAGLAHVYDRGGRSYNIRVMTIDTARNRQDYTFSEDGDLTAVLP